MSNPSHPTPHDLAKSIGKQIAKNLIPMQIALISEQQSVDTKALDLFKDLSSKDFEHVCNLLLGINCNGTVSATLDDVINCLVMFESAVQFAVNAEVGKQKNIKKTTFYKRYIDGAVQFAWKCVCTVLGGRQDKGVSVPAAAGMILMNMGVPDPRGRIRGNLLLPHHFQFEPNTSHMVRFKDLYDHLHRFGLFVKENHQGERKNFYLAGTVANAKKFMSSLQSRVYNTASTSSVSTVQDEASDNIIEDDITEEDSEGDSVERKNTNRLRDLGIESNANRNTSRNEAKVFNKESQILTINRDEGENDMRSIIHHEKGQTLQTKEEDNRSVQGQNTRSKSAHVSIEDAKTFHELLDLLPSTKLIDRTREEKLVMDLSDRVVFKNSYPVNKILFEELMRAFHPVDGPKPLDILAGITDEELNACITAEGPSLKLFLQKHPRENRFVTVITLENYLSQEYMKKKDALINQMSFQSPPGKSDDDKLLRVSTKTLPPGSPNPLITFGNNRNSLSFFQATADMTMLEADIVLMTNFVYKLIDEALNKAIEKMTHTIMSSSKERQIPKQFSPRDTKEPQKSRVFGFNLGKHSTKDAVDTLVSLAYKKHSYGHHNDADEKHCIHDNSNVITHANEMRIFSHRFRFGNTKGNANQIAASIIHGIPDSETNGKKHEFCHVVGYWSSNKDEFTRVIKGEKVEITMKGDVHAHIQMPGSQSNNLHHFIRDKDIKDDVYTLVMSPRMTHKLQYSESRQERVLGNYYNDSGAIISAKNHVIQDIVALFQNQKRTAPPPSYPRNHEVHMLFSPTKKMRSEQTNESAHLKDKWKISKTSYSNGFLMKEEYTNRQSVYGFPYKKGLKEQIGRSVHATSAWLNKEKTVYYQTNEGVAVVGPWVQEAVYQNNNDLVGSVPKVQLFRPGDVDETVCSRASITCNKHCKSVVSKKVVDVINLHRISKNGPGLAENLYAIFCAQAHLFGKKDELKNRAFIADKLVPFTMRGKGGAMTMAGSTAVDPSNKLARRDAPTHKLPIYQNFDDDIQSLLVRAGSEQTVNVFYQNHYIGLFYLDSVEFRSYTRTELRQHADKIQQVLQELNRLKPDLFPQSSLSREMEQELMGMLAKSFHFRLVPVDENFLKRWGWNNLGESIPWQIISLSDDDIDVPKWFEDKEGEKLMTLDESCTITDCFSLMKYSNDEFCFLKDKAKEAVSGNIVMDGEEDELALYDDVKIGQDDSTPSQNSGLRFAIEDLFNGAIHVAAVNLAKACDDRVVNAKYGQMRPLRELVFMFNGECRIDSDMYKAGLQSTGLKPLLTRPTHPHTVTFDPVSTLAYFSMKQFYRCTNLEENEHEQQWAVIFMCIFCSIVNPPAVLQLHQKWKKDSAIYQNRLVPSPSDLYDIINVIEKMRWESKFIHPIYRKVFTTKDKFIRFLKDLHSKGEKIFGTLMRKTELNRSDCLSSLVSAFDIFSPFQVHAFMRTIETCIFEPFGEVETVPSAYGGTCGARCFIEAFKKAHPNHAKCMTEKEILELIPSWIVSWYNDEVQTRLKTGKENIIQPTQDELLVLGLRWSEKYQCLVNTQGIQKKFDSSDAEHMLCMFYCLVVNTLPSRNIGKSTKPPRIDSEKYHPIYQAFDANITIEPPFMADLKTAYPQVMATHQKMLKSKTYEHCRLRDKFQIDI